MLGKLMGLNCSHLLRHFCVSCAPPQQGLEHIFSIGLMRMKNPGRKSGGTKHSGMHSSVLSDILNLPDRKFELMDYTKKFLRFIEETKWPREVNAVVWCKSGDCFPLRSVGAGICPPIVRHASADCPLIARWSQPAVR
jgi:hypothetical protein